MSDRADRLASALKIETLDGPARTLAEQAVIITRRLEMIDDQLSGRDNSWWYIRQRVPDHVEIKISGPMAEERQQAIALGVVLDKLARELSKEQGAAPSEDIADELARRRDERLAQGKDAAL